MVFEEDQVPRSLEDSLLRERIEEEERFNFIDNTEQQKTIESMVFFKPINGIITQGFNRHEKHYGVDLVSKENEVIKCVFDGVVVFSSWTSKQATLSPYNTKIIFCPFTNTILCC